VALQSASGAGDNDMPIEHVSIDGRPVGPGHPVYIVAELSGNHDGDLQRALDTIHAAREAGADAIKLQTYTPDTLTLDFKDDSFVVPGDGPWGRMSLYELYERAHTPWEWHEELFAAARSCQLQVFSSPFDSTAVDLLERLGSPAYKIASFELTDDGLLRRVAHTGKPVILSTGMANLEEISHALDVLQRSRANEVILLRCTSSYPAPDDSMDLATIPALAAATGRPVGLSDHSLGVTAAVVAVTLGACLVEKHFTLDRAGKGVDSHFSLEPHEFRELVRGVRRAELMLGDVRFGPGAAEETNIVFRRSLYIVDDIREGEIFTERNVRSIRPGFGLPPRHLDLILGRRAKCDLKRGTPVRWSHVTG
jgi:pseudaminic acid synthase